MFGGGEGGGVEGGSGGANSWRSVVTRLLYSFCLGLLSLIFDGFIDALQWDFSGAAFGDFNLRSYPCIIFYSVFLALILIAYNCKKKNGDVKEHCVDVKYQKTLLIRNNMPR